jgi:hypothetical protein
MRLAARCFTRVLFASGLLFAAVGNAGAQDAKPITFEDLQGTTINATVIYAQTFRRLDEDRIRNNTNTQTITLKIGPGDHIGQIHTVSITAPDGRHVGNNSFAGKFELNKPRKGTFGEIIWLFDDDKLVRLQTFESGGRRITLTFKRTPAGLTCSVDAPFAREDSGAVQTTGAVGGMKIQLLSMKQTSTNCRVDKAGG